MIARPSFRTLRALARLRDLWQRAARGLADVLPKGLYKRSLLIVILPMVLLQTAVTYVFMEHHWEQVTQRPVRCGGAGAGWRPAGSAS